MASVSAKRAPGRQSQLPLKRAFEISLKSLRIRFWRSIITAGGIFLGIAFLSTVLTQGLMQWPLPEKVDAGYVRISGQIEGPGDYEVWKPVPVREGIAAGIPPAIINCVAKGKDTFSLAAVVQGKLQALRADKNLARVNREWVGLRKVSQPLLLYIDVFADKDIKVSDAIKAGVPRRVARKLAADAEKYAVAAGSTRAEARKLYGKRGVFKGSQLVDVIREQPNWITPLYMAAALDQDITIGDAVKAGVPEAIARMLAGDGKTFKAGPLGDAINRHPTWIKIWKSRQKRYSIFKQLDDSAVARLDKQYAITLGELLKQAEGFSRDANKADVMIVNAGGRRVSADLTRNPTSAGSIKLSSQDTVLVPDINTKHRALWLVVMSLLVCTVGITNSMLMSVTERYKEIGTMKCLGALDKFVVTLFMLESGMMGVAASILGWAAGFLVMILIAGATKGWDMVGLIGISDVGRTLGLSVVVGLALTIVATIAPAVRAAGMPPAMALRSEI